MAQSGEVYRDTETDDKSEVVATPCRQSAGHIGDKVVELEKVEDGKWFTVYYDTFRSNYRKVADSVDDL